MITTVVHIKDDFDVYIGRPVRGRFQGSIWGNPYRIGQNVDGHKLTRAQAIAAFETLMRHRLAGPNGDWWRLQLEALRGQRLGCWCHPKPCHGQILVKLLDEFPRLAVGHRRQSLADLARRQPGALVIDLTSHAPNPWVRFSPFYPHGDIPVAFSPGCTSASVEGVWQGLKVFEQAEVDTGRFAITSMQGLKRTARRYGRILGHRQGVHGEALLPYFQARLQIYLPTYRWVLEHRLQPELAALAALGRQRPLVLLDYSTNLDVNDLSRPLSHAGLVAMYLQGAWPEENFSHLFRT